MERPKHISTFESLHQSIDSAIFEGKQQQIAFGLKTAETHFSNILGEIYQGEISALNERGLVYRLQKDFDAADADFHQALTLSLRTHNVNGMFNSLSGLMDSARKSGRISLAEDYRVEAEEKLSVIPEDQACIGIVNILINIGLLKHDTKEEVQALKNYGAAEVVCRRLIMQDPTDIDLQNRLARIFTVRPEAYKGLEMFEEAYNDQVIALDLNTKLGEVRGLGNSTYSLGETAEMINKPDEAKEWYEKSLEASQKVVDGKIEVIDPEINQMANNALLRLASNEI